MKSSKFIVFVDHRAPFNNRDCYVPLEGNTIMEAMISFNKKFNVYGLRDSVYLYNMFQKKGHEHNHYIDILINRGHGWNVEDSGIFKPLEITISDYRIKDVEVYEEN